METYPKRPAARARHTIGACLGDDGQPIYFHVPEHATDHQVAQMAFEAKHGREPDRVEWEMLQLIQRNRGPIDARLR